MVDVWSQFVYTTPVPEAAAVPQRPYWLRDDADPELAALILKHIPKDDPGLRSLIENQPATHRVAQPTPPQP